MPGQEIEILKKIVLENSELCEEAAEKIARAISYYGVVVPPIKIGTRVWLAFWNSYEQEWEIFDTFYDVRYAIDYPHVDRHFFLTYDAAKEFVDQKNFQKTT